MTPNHLRAAALRASVRDVRRILEHAPGPLDGSPMGGILESLRIGLSGNLQADRDAALYNRSMGADRHHVKAALYALMQKATSGAAFFDALAFEVSRQVKECRPKERVARTSELRPIFDWLQQGDILCLIRDPKGRRCPDRARDGKPYCREHYKLVEKGDLPEPSAVTRVSADGAEFIRVATVQDVEPRPKPGHRWVKDEHSWQLGAGKWVPEVEADEMNWDAVEKWEARSEMVADGYSVVLAYVPVYFTQPEMAAFLEEHVTVNQVRALRKRPALPPLDEPIGSLTVTKFREKIGTAHAQAAGVYVTAKDIEKAIDRYCDVVRESEAFAELFAMSEHGRLRAE